MINESLKLNPKIFSDDIEKEALRQGFGEGLLEAGRQDKNVVCLTCDLTNSTKTSLFKKEFPERFIEMGIQEQSMASVASGMSAMGKIPFTTSYAMFSPGRNWEQIRTTVCYNDRNVKFAGSHAGISVGPDGGTHQAIEDIAITRVLPKMVVLTPCDAIEAKKATMASAKTMDPTYIRLAREKTHIITTEETPFEIGKAQVFFKGEGEKKIGIVACGPLVYNSLVVAKELGKEGIGVSVLNLSTIKPIDKDEIVKLAREVEGIVTVEEHQIMGGMGSAVSEVLAKEYPLRMAFIGVNNEFGQSGTPEELIEHYGMGISSIKEAVLGLID